MKPTTSISLKSYRRGTECPIDRSYMTRAKISITPPKGQRFDTAGLDSAARNAAIAGMEMAAAFLRALPAGARYCIPAVEGGESWAEAATAWVTFEHDGDAQVIGVVKSVTKQASK